MIYTMRGLLALLALLALNSAWACRCEERPLGDYFAGADVVLSGRLNQLTTLDATQRLQIELIAPSYKGPLRSQGQMVQLSTPNSSAACAVDIAMDAFYIFFAQQSEQGLRVDRCSGSRVLLGAGMPPGEFIDVPARFVARQLNALAGFEVLKDVQANAPSASAPDNDTLIGLLDLAPLAHGGWVEVYRAPAEQAEGMGRILSTGDVATLEYSYELAGAMVYAHKDGWFRVRLASGEYGWLPPGTGTFFSYPELVVSRLGYLNENWSGFVWPEIGAGLPVRSLLASSEAHSEIPARVVEARSIGGMPWLRVEILSGNECESAAVRTTLAGWIPAYGRNGRPSAWFWSRGC